MQPRPGMSQQDKLLADVVVHAAIAFQSKNTSEILMPFAKMMSIPGQLKVIVYNDQFLVSRVLESAVALYVGMPHKQNGCPRNAM